MIFGAKIQFEINVVLQQNETFFKMIFLHCERDAFLASSFGVNALCEAQMPYAI